MTAKELKARSQQAQILQADKAMAERKAAEDREAKYHKWLEEIRVPEIREQLRAKMEAASNKGQCLVSAEFPINNREGEELLKKFAEELKKEGFEVQIESVYVPEYGGSNDDGYAYAHDSYWANSYTVRWDAA